MQKLLLPFKRQQIICGYKVAIYELPPSQGGHGYKHYGIDISSRQGYSTVQEARNDHVIYSSGDGTVVVCQRETGATQLGWAIAILYKDCVSHSGERRDLLVRYMHSDVCYVKKGDKVSVGTPICLEGTEGTRGENGEANWHCHFEIDSDTGARYYTWSPQVSKGHTVWVHGSDTTLNPSNWLWQSDDRVQDPYNFTNKAWINEVDKKLPSVGSESTQSPENLAVRVAELQSELAVAKAEATSWKEKYEGLRTRLENLIKSYM